MGWVAHLPADGGRRPGIRRRRYAVATPPDIGVRGGYGATGRTRGENIVDWQTIKYDHETRSSDDDSVGGVHGVRTRSGGTTADEEPS